MKAEPYNLTRRIKEGLTLEERIRELKDRTVDSMKTEEERKDRINRYWTDDLRDFDQELKSRGIKGDGELDFAEALALFEDIKHEFTVYYGFDCNKPAPHLGHALGLYISHLFADQGYPVVLLGGTTTAMIGDPTDRESKRKEVSLEDVEYNAIRFKEQVKFLMGDYDPTIIFNHDFHRNRPLAEYDLAAEKITVNKLLQSRIFKKRANSKDPKPLSLLELTYPIRQGIDATWLGAYVQIGGPDQIGNLATSRDLQRDLGIEPHAYITSGEIPGLDSAEKMGGSAGNAIEVTKGPFDLFKGMMQYKGKHTELKVREIYSKLLNLPEESSMEDIAHEFVAWVYGETFADYAEHEYESRLELGESLDLPFHLDIQFREELESRIEHAWNTRIPFNHDSKYNSTLQIGDVTLRGKWSDKIIERWTDDEESVLVKFSGTSPGIHLGQLKVLEKAKEKRDFNGYKLKILIGDHTAEIGSLAGNRIPVKITQEEAKKNSETIIKHIERVMGDADFEVYYNSDIFNGMESSSMDPLRAKIDVLECMKNEWMRKSFDKKGRHAVTLKHLDYPLRNSLSVALLNPTIAIHSSEIPTFTDYFYEQLAIKKPKFEYVEPILSLDHETRERMSNRDPHNLIHSVQSPYEIFNKLMRMDDGRWEEFTDYILDKEKTGNLKDRIAVVTESGNGHAMISLKEEFAVDIVSRFYDKNIADDTLKTFEFLKTKAKDRKNAPIPDYVKEVLPVYEVSQRLIDKVGFDESSLFGKSVPAYAIVAGLMGTNDFDKAKGETDRNLYIDGIKVEKSDQMVKLNGTNLIEYTRNYKVLV